MLEGYVRYKISDIAVDVFCLALLARGITPWSERQVDFEITQLLLQQCKSERII